MATRITGSNELEIAVTLELVAVPEHPTPEEFNPGTFRPR
jgi:hypothetical protein